MSHDISVPIKSITTEIRVIRADGTVHNLGVVEMYSKSPLKKLWWSWFGKRAADRRIAMANKYVRG